MSNVSNMSNWSDLKDDDWCPSIVNATDVKEAKVCDDASDTDIDSVPNYDGADLMWFVNEPVPHWCCGVYGCDTCSYNLQDSLDNLEMYRASSNHLRDALDDLSKLLFYHGNSSDPYEQHALTSLRDSIDYNVRRMCDEDYDEYIKQAAKLEEEAAMVKEDRDIDDYNDKLYEFDIVGYTDKYDSYDDPDVRLKRRKAYKTPMRWNDGVLKTRKAKKYVPREDVKGVKEDMKEVKKKLQKEKEVKRSKHEKQQQKVESETTENDEETDKFHEWLVKTYRTWRVADDERRNDIKRRKNGTETRVCRFTYHSWGWRGYDYYSSDDD